LLLNNIKPRFATLKKIELKKITILLVLFPTLILAQLNDFCGGDKGDAIFLETFGDASTVADPSSIGSTSYTFVDEATPVDGSYTISAKFNWFSTWFTTADHTEGDTGGKALIVNADRDKSGIFFERKITGLCQGTTYEFSAWMLNITSLTLADECTRRTGIPGGIPINVRFEIWDETDTLRLKFGDTGDIFSDVNPDWKKYGLTFKTVTGQENVILKIYNNGKGGCGNDLALDDIQFASCGDRTFIESTLKKKSPAEVCDAAGLVGLTVNVDKSVIKTAVYQWQKSSDGITFVDVIGETKKTVITEDLNTKGDYYYRAKIAETELNLLNPFCSSFTDSYLIRIYGRESDPITKSTVTFCAEDVVSLNATPSSARHTLRWFDRRTGGREIAEGNTINLGKLAPGNYTFYVEAYDKLSFECPSLRVPVSLTVFGTLADISKNLFICPEEVIDLESLLEGASYKWSTGQTTKIITVTKEGEYSVNITNTDGCVALEKFEIFKNTQSVVIKEVKSDQDKVIIVPEFDLDYEYSINGIDYQNSPIFDSVKTGEYTAYIRGFDFCNRSDQKDFFHLNIPKFFTPNRDGFEDEYIINSIKKVSIFNRYGRLIVQRLGEINWDGTLNGRTLPSDTYWYMVETKNSGIFKGHFLLKR